MAGKTSKTRLTNNFLQMVNMFLEEESQHLAMLGDFIGKPISLQVETVFPQEHYDIILM